MDNVLIVVDDLEAAIAFLAELGLELEGRTTVEGQRVDRVVGFDGVRSDIAMMRTPDGHGRIELDKFHTPAAIRAEPEGAPVYTLGIRRIMFAVDDVEDVLARLRAHGAQLIGEVEQYEGQYRLCYVRAPRASSSRRPSSSPEAVEGPVRDTAPRGISGAGRRPDAIARVRSAHGLDRRAGRA